MDFKKIFVIALLTGLLAACEKKSESEASEAAPDNGTVESVTSGKDGADGKDGINGVDGKDGLNGTNGIDGKDGLNGTNGINGKDGLNGTNGINGKDGLNGTNGVDGKDGKNAVLAVVSLVVDRSITWTDNRVNIPNTGVLTLPGTIDVLLLANTENGGWIDFIIERSDGTVRHRYCYQGMVGQKRYAFVYKKAAGSLQGCDQNNEKETSMVSTSMDVVAGDDFVVIPRAPRLSGIKPTFTFHYLGIEL